MPWPCYLVETAGHTDWIMLEGGGRMQKRLFKDAAGSTLQWEDLRPGAMWFDDDRLHVKLPGTKHGSDWDIDLGRICKERGDITNHPVWTREGEPPNVTAHPSINWVGHYHGWLQDGALTSDVEGRVIEGEPK